jgi:hypothetical protein
MRVSSVPRRDARVCGDVANPAPVLKHRAIVKRPTGRGSVGFQASLAGTRGCGDVAGPDPGAEAPG